MKTDIIETFLILVVVWASASLVWIFGQASIRNDCEKLGGFYYSGVTYECKVKDKQ